MKNKKARIKSIIAFGIVLVLVLTGLILDRTDQIADVIPGENSMICLYGEAHGYKKCYDVELEEWRKFYADGCRNLFVELPYYSAEFLNVWMRADSDEMLDQWFEEIKNTLSGNEYYKKFFREIKKYCPDTVFYGTDVGHQSDTTGARYLKYLEDNGLEASESYTLAKECIRQGQEYQNEDTEHNGISALRENYMVSNFIDAYTRCGGGKIMGIYGSYHTAPENAELMAGRLKTQYGDIISGVKVSTFAFSQLGKPYDIGFCVTGLVFLLMLFVPNIIWARKEKPVGYEESAKKENKILLALERIGEVLMSVSLVVFTAINPKVMIFEGFFFEWKIIIWVTAFVLMILYECYWIRYFRSQKTMKDFYASFAGFPVAGATLPVVACLLLGIYSGNAVVILSSIILGIGHIGIHLTHKKDEDRY